MPRKRRYRRPPHQTNCLFGILRIEIKVGYAVVDLVGDALTKERIILDHGYEVLIVGEKRFRSG